MIAALCDWWRKVTHNENNKSRWRAKNIKIHELAYELELLAAGQQEFDIMGIHHKNEDCLYFSYSDKEFNIEYELREPQHSFYIQQLELFAKQNKIRTTRTGANNTPIKNATASPPMLVLHTQSNLAETVRWAEQIQAEVFGNDKETNYEIVP